MKRLSFFLVGMLLFLQCGQAQVARHFWLNQESYNHTLYPTSDGGYILAAARQQFGARWRNTIAVLKLDQNYQLQNSRIIGIPFGGGEDWFDPQVNFEVHDIREVKNPDDGNAYYVICGAINHYAGDGEVPNPTTEMGVVVIVDFNLHVQSIREYPDAQVFNSVYANGNYFYVCGKTTNNEGIVLRDDMFVMNPTTQAYITNQIWEYHKIKSNNNGNDLVVSGTDWNEIGFSAFDIVGGSFSPIINPITGQVASQKFLTPQPINPKSKIALTNYPGYSQGLILSSSRSHRIYVYLFDIYYQIPLSPQASGFAITDANQIFHPLFLEDIAAVGNASQFKIALVGNREYANSLDPTAFYISGDISFRFQPPNPNPIPVISNPVYIYYSTPSSEYFRLHKVHYNAGDFHCGGFYNHTNNDKTTFVVAPEQANNCGVSSSFIFDSGGPSPITVLPINPINVKVNPNKWLEKKYKFCDVDCDNKELDENSNNNNCGNQIIDK